MRVTPCKLTAHSIFARYIHANVPLDCWKRVLKFRVSFSFIRLIQLPSGWFERVWTRTKRAVRNATVVLNVSSSRRYRSSHGCRNKSLTLSACLSGTCIVPSCGTKRCVRKRQRLMFSPCTHVRQTEPCFKRLSLRLQLQVS